MTWGLTQLSSAIEDQHGMDTEFYNKHKIQSFLAIVKSSAFFFFFFFKHGERIIFSQVREEGYHSHKVTGYLPCCRMKYHPRCGT